MRFRAAVAGHVSGDRNAVEQLARLVGRQYRRLAFFHDILWAAHGVGRVYVQDAARHKPVEQHSERGQVLLHRGRLSKMPGKLLIFVHYSPRHIFHMEWVYNADDIDHSRIVWARDLGTSENEKLLRYYPDRAAWFFQPDDGGDLSRYSGRQTFPHGLY